jgi:2-polyprenyl-3-methyl-5-hydroxy-6-metoxy-1,4-benzoquinol methylase
MELVDPVDKTRLTRRGARLVSESGHEYHIIQDVPVLLVQNAQQTHGAALASLAADESDPYFLETVAVTPPERAALRERIAKGRDVIDPVVQFLAVSTSGRLYKSRVGNLPRYPIPELRLPQGDGKTLLDIGSSWGRWSIAAARKGYRVTAIDPSLGAVLAGKRVAKSLGLEIEFIVGDARFLPFRDESFDRVFSYGVIQHFSKANAAVAVKEIGRVLKADGDSLVQMPNKFGMMSLYHQAHRRFSDGRDFNVRYWHPRALAEMFSSCVGRSRLSVDAYFGLGIQFTDVDLLPPIYKAVVITSHILRKASETVRPLLWFADSLYIHSVRSS